MNRFSGLYAAVSMLGGLTNSGNVHQASPKPLGPEIVINEVLFDAKGVAGSPGSWQYVELATRTPLDLSGYQLVDYNGNLLCTLPSVSIPKDHLVLVEFGPHVPAFDNLDPNKGSLVITVGSGWGDYLGVSSGGVALKKASQVVDQIYWGTAFFGKSPFFDTSFTNGEPVEEGDSIGREMHNLEYSGTVADFASNGGRNAIGPTPGASNKICFFSQSELIEIGDNIFNQLCLSLSSSSSNAGWLGVVSTTPTPISYEEKDTYQNSISNHVYTLRIQGNFVQVSGNIATRYARSLVPNDTKEFLYIQGSLSSVDGLTGLDFTLDEEHKGFHGSSYTESFSSSAVLRLAGVPYPVSTQGTRTVTDVAPGKASIVDQRTGIDFGGAGVKTSSGSGTIEQIADGKRRMNASISRSYPSLPPFPGNSQTASGKLEELVEDLTLTQNGFAETTNGTIDTFTQKLGNVLVRKLQPGQKGSIQISSNALDAQNTVNEIVYSVPMVNAAGLSALHEMIVQGVTSQAGGKEVSTGNVRMFVGGHEKERVEFSIDPPMCLMHGAQCKNCPLITEGDPNENPSGLCSVCQDKAPSPPAGPGGWTRTKDFVWRSVTCTATSYATVAVVSKEAGKATLKAAGVSIGSKAIPIIGWGILAGCTLWAIGDQIWGYNSNQTTGQTQQNKFELGDGSDH